MLPWWAWAIAACWRSRAALVAEHLCLRQQLLVLRRRQLRPRLSDRDRRFWILASRWFPGWQDIIVVVSAATVLRWHHRGWRAYWRWGSRRGAKAGRHPVTQELQALIRRMTLKNRLWGQRRIQAELARLGFKVSASTVAKYMHRAHYPGPLSHWRSFLKQQASTAWACDFFCVQTCSS
jgi:putative transposase